jgi:thiol reductant ABC exporter CydD subunit
MDGPDMSHTTPTCEDATIVPVRPSRTRLVHPDLADRVPAIRSAASAALVIGALTAVCVVVQAAALATAIDRSLVHHVPLSMLRPELIALALAVAARAVLGLVGERTAERTAESVVTVMRGQLLRHVLALGPGWLGGERPGELSLTATRGLRSLHTYFSRYLPQAAAAAVIPVVLLAWIASQDWLSLVIVVALVVAVPITMIYFGREANRRTARQWRRLGSLAGRFLQLIEGLPTLRAFGRDAYGRREVVESTEGVRVATMRTLRVAFLSALSMDLIAGFGVGFVAMALGLRLLWGELDLQTAMAVLLVTPEIFIPLRRAGAEFHASTEGQAAAARVIEILALAPDNATGSAATDRVAATSSPLAGAAPGRSAVDLRIDGLRVTYVQRSSPALEGFSLHVPAGTRVALVGPSGAGKSSVVAALLGFVAPSAGSISVDGTRSCDVPVAQWRTQFSWLPQRPYLFTATLAENLRLGAPEATDELLERVTAAVGLDRLVAHLPRGLATQLGQDGLTLSTGERQRVALARALLRPAPILLLDEPTASLDPPTTARMAHTIEPWLDGRTVIVTAHEPTLLTHFDDVVDVRGAPLPAGTP